MGKTTLPPGFRFHPTDVELVKYYLKRKILGKKLHFEGIAEVEIYKCAPWDLPGKSCLHSGDLKWYFFCPRERKYASGSRINRATKFGYWKSTGKDRPVHYNNEVVGMIRTLVFHRGRSPHGERTDWVIHEYRLDEKNLALNGVVQDSYVLCMLFEKDGPGPRNGSQYGAPFEEDNWIDDEENNVNGPSTNASTVDVVPSNYNNYVAISKHAPGSSSMSIITNAGPVPADATAHNNSVAISKHAPGSSSMSIITNNAEPVPADATTHNNSIAISKHAPGSSSMCFITNAGPVPADAMTEKLVPEDDDIAAMLALFTEEECNDPHGWKDNGAPRTDVTDIYKDLGDLGNLTALCEDNSGASAGHRTTTYSWDQVLPVEGEPFLELIDLDTPLGFPDELFKNGYNYYEKSGPAGHGDYI